MANQTTPAPDSDVIELIAAGDTPDALRRLMQRHGNTVYRYCCQALGDPELAEDVRQQVFIEAFRDLPKFCGRSSLRTWLFSIARHRVLDAVRRRRRSEARVQEREHAKLATMGDPRPSPAESLELRQTLEASLAALGDDERTTVLLRLQLGYSFQEIAELCGASPSAHHARVMRALPLLRQSIQSRIDSSRRAPRDRDRLRRAS
jgi:RNA polymerase sigma-70 factor (ECF subfamily)